MAHAFPFLRQAVLFVFSFSFIFVYLKNYFKFGNNDRTVFYVCVGLFVLLLSVEVFCLYIGQGETSKMVFYSGL